MMTRARTLALLCLPLLAPACGREVRTERPTLADSVWLRDAQPADTTAGPELATVLYSERDADVTARKDGVVRAVRAELGDPVAAGALLALLEDDEEAARAEHAAAAAELARAELERARALRQQNVLTLAEYETALYRARAAEAALREARVRVEHTRVRAPFAGVVTRRYVRLGQGVEEGDPLFRVTALRPLRAQLRVPELDARRLARGQTLALHATDGTAVRGTVLRIAPAVEPASGTVEVLIEVRQPGTLRPGSAVSVLWPPPPAPRPDGPG